MYVVLMSQTCRPCDGNTRSCFHNRQEDEDGGRVDVASAVQGCLRGALHSPFPLLAGNSELS
jgi:hypothetical protein